MPKTATDSLGQLHLKEWRKWRGLSQEELAEAAGMSVSNVSQLEQGKQGYSQAGLRRIAAALGSNPGDLFNAPTAFSVASYPRRVDQRAMVECKRIELEQAPPHIQALAKAGAGNRKAELWQLQSDSLSGAGYQAGDYLIVDLEQEARARDVVLAATKGDTVCRLFFPPYLFTVPVPGGKGAPPLTVDHVIVTIKGIVVGKFSV